MASIGKCKALGVATKFEVIKACGEMNASINETGIVTPY
jgi:hypothetical protein